MKWIVATNQPFENWIEVFDNYEEALGYYEKEIADYEASREFRDEELYTNEHSIYISRVEKEYRMKY